MRGATMRAPALQYKQGQTDTGTWRQRAAPGRQSCELSRQLNRTGERPPQQAVRSQLEADASSISSSHQVSAYLRCHSQLESNLKIPALFNRRGPKNRRPREEEPQKRKRRDSDREKKEWGGEEEPE